MNYIYRIFPAVLACFVAVGVSAQSGLLWKVSKPGSKKVSYLFGTMHTSDSLCNTWSDAWWEAFRSCEVVAGEADFGDFSQAFEALSMSLMKDTLLSELYSPEDYAFVDSVMKAGSAPGMGAMHRKVRPLISMIALMEQPDTSGPFGDLMDRRLQQMARQDGKEVVGLESAKEQMKSIAVLSLQEEAAILLEFLRSNQGVSAYISDMAATYVQQDLKLLAEDPSMKQLPPRLLTALLDERNDRFLSRAVPLMKKKRVFCAVGAMHLVGDTGMIAGLRNAGFEVVPEPFTFTAPVAGPRR